MIQLGYEIGTGKRVDVPINHMAVLGQTQLSGKTTTVEAMVTRSGLRAIAFITKPGEKSFRLQTSIPAFFSESTSGEYWKYVTAIVESHMEVKLGWRERGWITKLCREYDRAKTKSVGGYKWKRPKTLTDVLTNVETALPHLRGTEEMICMQLQEFLRPAVREIERAEFSDKLKLRPGINVMDVSSLSPGVQMLVIRSVIAWIHRNERRTITIIPEAWKFIPEGRSTPVKLALEALIREGAGVGNFVWMDSQDLRGVDKMLLRSVIVWLFGVQRQRNEVASTLDSIPDHPKPTASQIMQLGKGEFYVCYANILKHTYVQPAGMEDPHAQAIARGEESADSWKSIVRSLDAEEKESEPDGAGGIGIGDGALAERNVRIVDGDRQDRRAGDRAEDLQTETVEGDEVMWKEKYEALKAEHQQLIEAHDALALRLKQVEDRVSFSVAEGETVYSDVPSKEPAIASADRAVEAAGTRPPAASAAVSNGIGRNGAPAMHDLYIYVRERLLKEAPATLRLALEQMEIRVNLQRNTIDADGSGTMGRIALLITEKFFDTAKDAGAITREFKRRGWFESKASNAALIKPLAQIAEWGFLTREESGFQVVAGMKVHIHESKSVRASA